MVKRISLLTCLTILVSMLMGGVTTFLPGGGSNNGAFSGTAPAAGSFTPDTNWVAPDLDDEPGVADGAGADPNPFPGDWKGIIQSGVHVDASTYMLNPVHEVTRFNGPGTGQNANLYVSSDNWEYGYQPPPVHSGSQYVEHYWQIQPKTTMITFAGGSGSIVLGDNITFSDGAVCRPAQAGTVGTNKYRFTCVGGVAPASGATIASCTGTCTGPPAGSVNGTPIPDTTAWRPYFYEWHSDLNRVNWDQRRGVLESTTPGVAGTTPLYWMSCQSGDNVCHVGHGGYTTPDAEQARFSIPYADNTSFTNLASAKGDIDVDTTMSAATGGVPRFEFAGATSATWVSPFFGRYALSPVTTECTPIPNVTNASLNVDLNLTTYQPITLVAMGCRDNTTDAPGTAAQMTLETLAGASITLSGTLTCVGKSTTMTWVTIDSGSDTDAVLPSGAGVRIDTANTPNPATDTYNVCVAFVATRV